jgi:predicted SprT family Zn-dependent metalloprotease
MASAQLTSSPNQTIIQPSLFSFRQTPAEVLRALQAEFDRLNAHHFKGELKVPVIDLSRRKSFGGYYQPGRHRIVLSWQAYEEHGWEEILNTFRHEVAHIVHFNHSRAFWDLAYQIGVTKRYASRPLKQPRTPHRYVYECAVCHRRVYRNRRMRKSSCGSCDKVYNPAFPLKLVSQS